jgi:hypothetical protein
MSLRPASKRGLKRRGECALCGKVGPLTRTHVPPRCAGNDGDVQRPVITEENGTPSLQKGRPYAGGAHDFLLCERCNNTAGLYDPEFCRWWRHAVADVNERSTELRATKVGDDDLLTIDNADPGAFIRSALTGLFAVGLPPHRVFPDIANAILTGEAVPLPRGLRFRMAYTIGPHGFGSGGGGRAFVSPHIPGGLQVASSSGLLVAGAVSERVADASVCWPPLWLLAVRGEDASRYPHRDYSAWLAEAPGATR